MPAIAHTRKDTATAGQIALTTNEPKAIAPNSLQEKLLQYFSEWSRSFGRARLADRNEVIGIIKI